MTRGGLFPFFITIRRHSSTHPLRLLISLLLLLSKLAVQSAEAINAKYILIHNIEISSHNHNFSLSFFSIHCLDFYEKMSAKLCLLLQKRESSSFILEVLPWLCFSFAQIFRKTFLCVRLRAKDVNHQINYGIFIQQPRKGDFYVKLFSLSRSLVF